MSSRYYISATGLGTVGNHGTSQIVTTGPVPSPVTKDLHRMNRIERGEHWLTLSLAELLSIQDNLNSNDRLNHFESAVDEAKQQWDILTNWGEVIQEQRRNLKLWKLKDVVLLIRDVRSFEKASRAFHRNTKLTSDKVSRKVSRRMLSNQDLSVQAEQPGNTLPPESDLSGFTVEIPSPPNPEILATLEKIQDSLRELERRINQVRDLQTVQGDPGPSTSNNDQRRPTEKGELLNPYADGDETISQRYAIRDLFNVNLNFHGDASPTIMFAGERNSGAILLPKD